MAGPPPGQEWYPVQCAAPPAVPAPSNKHPAHSYGTNPATRYLYDVNAGLPVLLEDGTCKYVWGLGLAYAIEVATGAIEVYHEDGLGSVRALTDASGQVVQVYDTDEFGVPARTQGSRMPSPSAIPVSRGMTKVGSSTGEPARGTICSTPMAARPHRKRQPPFGGACALKQPLDGTGPREPGAC